MTEEEENDIELIERYHKGTLKAEELQSIKDRMAADPSFAQKVEDFKDIFIGIKAHGEKKFSEMVGHWENYAQEQEKTIPMLTRARLINLAAVLVLVAAIGTMFLFLGDDAKKTPEELYAGYFTPYANIIEVRGDTMNLLLEGMTAYSSRDFKGAAELLSKYSDSNPDDLNALFYLGLSEIASGNPYVGIQQLEHVIVKGGLLKEQAEWYRALGLLRMEEVEACKAALKPIDENKDHDYQKKASELLDALP